MTSNPGNQSVDLLLDDGAGGFEAATHHYVLMSPQAVVPVDADADGRPDLAVPCRGSDAVAVLIARRPGPPAFSAAVRYPVGPSPRPRWPSTSTASTASTSPSRTSWTRRCRSCSTTARDRSRRSASRGRCASTPSAIVAGDFDRDGIQDLAVSSTGDQRGVRASRHGRRQLRRRRLVRRGLGPDDLAAADVDGDGDLDLLVCNRVSGGTVALLRNTSTAGAIAFVSAGSLRGRAGPHVHLRRPPGRQLHARLRRRELHGHEAHRPLRRRDRVTSTTSRRRSST